jgi:uncharacterized protein YggE
MGSSNKENKEHSQLRFLSCVKDANQKARNYTTSTFKTRGRVFSNQERMMQTVKRSLRKNKIKDKNIQELWSSFDVGPSRHLS